MYIIMQFVHGSFVLYSTPKSSHAVSHYPSIESGGEILETVVDIQEAWSQWGEIVFRSYRFSFIKERSIIWEEEEEEEEHEASESISLKVIKKKW